MSMNEGRSATGRQDVQQLVKEFRLEFWLLRLILHLFRRRLGVVDSWRRTHCLSLLHWHLLRSQGTMCGMWGWADYPKPNENLPIIHTASYASSVFFMRDYDSGLTATLTSIHRMLATEIIEQVDLVQDERAKA